MQKQLSTNNFNNQLAPGGLPSLSDFVSVPSLVDFGDLAEEPVTAWPKGWYSAWVLQGYVSPRGKVFHTSDEPSKNGKSRNLRLCLGLRNAAEEERLMQQVLNYRPMDFTPERLALVKRARSEFNGVRGRWSDTDIQRSSLALAKLGMLENTAGCRLKRTQEGTLDPEVFIGKAVDVYVRLDAQGYNEVSLFAPAGHQGLPQHERQG